VGRDLTPREVLTFVPLLIMAFWIGLYPKPFFEILEQPVNQLVQTVHTPQPGAPANAVLHPAIRPSLRPSLQTAQQPVAVSSAAVTPVLPAKGKN
jgi:NADH-quinone oxidoreductase subunit M